MRDGSPKALEMTGRGKRGKPKTGFPPFPPPLEIAPRFPHSHRLDYEFLFPNQLRTHQILERIPYSIPTSSRLIFRLEYAVSWYHR